jgi:glycosyltransferase involved in cell wall biosynthesis
VPDETLVQRYNQAQVVLYAPQDEPFGLVPLEAMACETPVIGIAEGGVRETVIDGETGRLLPRSGPVWAAAIAELLADAPERDRLGRQGRQQVLSNWTWEEAAARVEAHLLAAARA